jgi:hypothetical protein
LIEYAVSLAGCSGPTRLCFVPAAQGDNPLALGWFEVAFGNDLAIVPSVLTLFGRVELHYVGCAFHEAVSVLPGKRACLVEGDRSTEIVPRFLGGSGRPCGQ